MMWQILVVGVVLVLVALVVGYLNGLERGERLGRETRPRAETELADDEVLFGTEPTVRAAEEAFVHAMPEAVILVDGEGTAVYVGKRAADLGLIDSGRLVDEDASGILARVVADGKSREREIELPIDPDHAGAPVIPGNSGHGVQAGERMPSNTRYLKVRVSAIGDDRYAMFIGDMSEQRRFEAMRRDFMTNVSHELKTPAGAISLLAETIGDAADDPDAVRYFAGRVAKESTRLTELVHRLIDLQKAQDAAGVLDAKRLSVLAVARNAIAENQVQADGRHIELDLSFEGKAVPLVAPDADAAPGGGASRDDGAVSGGFADSAGSSDSASDRSTGGNDSASDNSVDSSASVESAKTDVAPGSAGGVVSSASHDDGASATSSEPSSAPAAEPDVHISCDEESITTAVKNLIENAIHYSPEHTTVRIAIATKDDGGKVAIRVIDQGIGIPPESIDRIFERFYRVDPARSRETGGTGLGLAITKHCVADCGGTVSVWSHEGEGSTFTIELPTVA